MTTKQCILTCALVLTLSGNINAGTELLEQNTKLSRKRYAKQGWPSLYNCEPKKETAYNLSLPINFELTISPKWTNRTEFMKDLTLPKKYSWSYRMVKEIEINGQNVDQNIDIQPFESHQKSSLTFPSYSLSHGFYKIYPNAKRKNVTDNLKPFMIKVCYLNVVGLNPIAIITGGNYRVVPSGTTIILNGSESIDLNTPTRSGSKLTFSWSYTQNRQPISFCIRNPISTDPYFTVPSKYIYEGNSFEVALTVTSKYKSVAKAYQKIDVVKDALLLEIKCEKNCLPASQWSNPKSITYFSVQCRANCQNINEDFYFWTLKSSNRSFTFDYGKHTQFGRRGAKFIVSEDVLEPGEYFVEVVLRDFEGSVGQAMMTLVFEAAPKIHGCVVNPKEGYTLETFFTLQCKQAVTFERLFYEVYATKSGQDVSAEDLIVDGFYPQIFTKLFLLPSSLGSNFWVKVSKENGPSTLVSVHPNVHSLLETKATKEILTKFEEIYMGQSPNRSVYKMITSKDVDKREMGFQKFQALVDELLEVTVEDEKIQHFAQNLKYQAVEDLLNVPFTSVGQIIKMGNVVSKLMSYNETNQSEPLLAKFSSTLCRKMVDKHIDMVKKHRFPLSTFDVSGKVIKTLSKCLEANLNPKNDIFKPIPVNITTPLPIKTGLHENYPNHLDFRDDQYESLVHLHVASYNVFSAAAASAKTWALTMAAGEKWQRHRGKWSEILVAKDKPKALAKTKLEVDGAVLIPPSDLFELEHDIDVLISSWTKNILWWNPDHVATATNIVNVQFWHSTCKQRINKFEDAADIYLDVVDKSFKTEYVEDVVQTPETRKQLFHQELNPYIHVRRVDLSGHRTLWLQIDDFTHFDFALTVFKFPTIEDFTNNHNTDTISIANLHPHRVWAYVGILPKNKARQTLRMGFVTHGCLRWSHHKNKWQPSCSPGHAPSLTIIHCKCNEFSTIAGSIQNVRSIRQEVQPADLLLEVQTNYLVFATVASTIFLYCVLLLFVLVKRRKNTLLYFLSDNKPSDRYAYMLIVQTGKTGTTSRVTIRLTGKHTPSAAHVLNHPDPKNLLFQKNCTDVFVLTDQHSLGEILQIEVWIDGSGSKPSWYCTSIEVYDLQINKSYYFNANRLLSVHKNIRVELKPCTKTENVFKKIRFWNPFHVWCVWVKDDCFSYVQRLTVLLSTVLMLYALVIIFERVPDLEASDSIDLDRYHVEWDEVFVAFNASLITFLLHTIIAWSLRLSHPRMSVLPYSTNKSCWRVLSVVIVISSTLLTVWSFWIPYLRSLVWLSTCIIGLALHVVLYESVLAIIAGFFYKTETMDDIKNQQRSIVLSTIEQQRFHLFDHFGDSSLQPLESKNIKVRL